MEQKTNKAIPKMLQRLLRGETAGERLLHRLHSVVLGLKGFSASEIARIHGDSPRAVAYWLNRYNRGGVAALKDEQRPGRPTKLDQKQMKMLQKFLEEAALKGESVNADAVAGFVSREFRVSLTVRQCWRILKKFKS